MYRGEDYTLLVTTLSSVNNNLSEFCILITNYSIIYYKSDIEILQASQLDNLIVIGVIELFSL